MKKEDWARTLAREANLSRAAARDEVDELVGKIVKDLKRGEAVRIPGLGDLVPVGELPGKPPVTVRDSVSVRHTGLGSPHPSQRGSTSESTGKGRR